MLKHIALGVQVREIDYWHVTCNRRSTARARERGAWQEATLKFEIYIDEAGEYRWRLFASDGQVIATSASKDDHRTISSPMPVEGIINGEGPKGSSA